MEKEIVGATNIIIHFFLFFCFSCLLLFFQSVHFPSIYPLFSRFAVLHLLPFSILCPLCGSEWGCDPPPNSHTSQLGGLSLFWAHILTCLTGLIVRLLSGEMGQSLTWKVLIYSYKMCNTTMRWALVPWKKEHSSCLGAHHLAGTAARQELQDGGLHTPFFLTPSLFLHPTLLLRHLNR